MPKTTTTKTFKKGDVSVKITVTDAHNVSAGKSKKSTKKSTRKTKRRKLKKDSDDIFYY